MRYLKALFFCFLFVMPSAWSAEIKFVLQEKDMGGGKFCRIELSGRIENGDAEKFERLIAENPLELFATTYVHLGSPGGSIADAIRISRTIESIGLAVAIPPGKVCASACALIYLSAPARLRMGRVAIHRPYFDVSKVHSSEFDALSKKQQEAILLLRQSLESKAIPSRIIDNMMSLPSDAAYDLTEADDRQIGYLSPMIEEISLQKCGVGSRNLFDGNLQSNFSCVQNAALNPIKHSYFHKKYGYKNLELFGTKVYKQNSAPYEQSSDVPPLELKCGESILWD